MQWIKDNAVGLVIVVLGAAAGYAGFYSKVDANSKALVVQALALHKLDARVLAESTTLQSTIIRLTSLESQIPMLTDTNQRVVIALDKLAVLYHGVTVTSAVQDERIRSIMRSINTREEKLRNDPN